MADVQESDRAFKQVFSYFFSQQRYSKAAGAVLRCGLKKIEKLRRLSVFTNENLLELDSAVKHLALALTAAKLSGQAEWGYSIAGSAEVQL